ncbi:hypothetical protein O6H91_14G008500 [Diphasiastrum complanatum]|uniref:Uncharacterized protein n=1 Tax=Diphasiastrum complanatum TaxID=34168 RepID=A0ACC2BLE6_DIPCM|nr:hypothetical protein O6H91_14G008500 [Diphasiastrum complanatum]
MAKRVKWFSNIKKAFTSPGSKTPDNTSTKNSEKFETLSEETLVYPSRQKISRDTEKWNFTKTAPQGFHELSNVSNHTSYNQEKLLIEAEDEHSRHALAVAMATAAAAEAAVAAAQAAAAVVRLTGGAAAAERRKSFYGGKTKAEWAAIKIQAAFRSYLARRALRALKGLVRLQALVRGQFVRRQTTLTMRSMQALLRVQSRLQERRQRLPSIAERNSMSVIQRDAQQRAQQHFDTYDHSGKQVLHSQGSESKSGRWDNGAPLAPTKSEKILSKQLDAAKKREQDFSYADPRRSIGSKSNRSDSSRRVVSALTQYKSHAKQDSPRIRQQLINGDANLPSQLQARRDDWKERPWLSDYVDFENLDIPDWSWSWLEQWMANEDPASSSNDFASSVKSSEDDGTTARSATSVKSPRLSIGAISRSRLYHSGPLPKDRSHGSAPAPARKSNSTTLQRDSAAARTSSMRFQRIMNSNRAADDQRNREVSYSSARYAERQAPNGTISFTRGNGQNTSMKSTNDRPCHTASSMLAMAADASNFSRSDQIGSRRWLVNPAKNLSPTGVTRSDSTKQQLPRHGSTYGQRSSGEMTYSRSSRNAGRKPFC